MTNYICTKMCFHNNRLYEVGEKMKTGEDDSPYFKSTDPEPVDPPGEDELKALVKGKMARSFKKPVIPEIDKDKPKKTTK